MDFIKLSIKFSHIWHFSTFSAPLPNNLSPAQNLISLECVYGFRREKGSSMFACGDSVLFEYVVKVILGLQAVIPWYVFRKCLLKRSENWLEADWTVWEDSIFWKKYPASFKSSVACKSQGVKDVFGFLAPPHPSFNSVYLMSIFWCSICFIFVIPSHRRFSFEFCRSSTENFSWNFRRITCLNFSEWVL